MRVAWAGLLGSCILFAFLYAWYLPAHTARQLVLDLPANNISKEIVIRDDVKIDQVITLHRDANTMLLPLQVGAYGGSGKIHLNILQNEHNVLVAQDQIIPSNNHGEIVFEFPGTPMHADTQYDIEFTFSGIQKGDDIRLATAFGKYANLSGTVQQYVLHGNNWKLVDMRHGNIALSVYYNPPASHTIATLQTFLLPAIFFTVIGVWGIRVLRGMESQKINRAKLRWREWWSIAGIGILLAVIATAPLYIHPSYISNHGDINRGLVYNAIAKRDIFSGHLPAWNQYICGGMPLIGDLESWFLHPLFFLTLPFSEVVAMKITYTLVLVSAFIGFYVFARMILRFQINGSFLFALIMAFGGYLSAHLAEGYYVWAASAYIPWFLVFAMLALKDIRFVPLAGLMLACMFGAGSMHMVVYSMLFVVLAWIYPISHRTLSERAVLFFSIAAWFVLFSAIKLLPAFSILTASTSREGFAPFVNMLPEMLFGRGLLAPVIEAGQTIRWGEFDGYVGLMSGIVAIVGAILFRKKLWSEYRGFIVASVAMLIISFMPLPITHGFISHVLDLFRMPSRVVLFALFGMALVAGYAMDQLAQTPHTSPLSQNRRGEIIAFIIMTFIACDLISNDITLFSRTFTVPIPELHAETKFHRVSNAYTTPDETYYRTIYIDYLEHRGTNDVCRFYQAGPFSRAIDETDPRYISQGEVYLKDANAGTISYSMNNRSEYTIHVDVTSATSILVNQNYYPGWFTNSKQVVENNKGIISIPVAAGDHDITLSYRPKTVYWGILIVVLGCLCTGILWMRKRCEF